MGFPRTSLGGRVSSVAGRHRVTAGCRWPGSWPVLTLRGGLARGDADEQGACVTGSGAEEGPGGGRALGRGSAVCRRTAATETPIFVLSRAVPGSEEIYDLGVWLAAHLASPEGLGDAFG